MLSPPFPSHHLWGIRVRYIVLGLSAIRHWPSRCLPERLVGNLSFPGATQGRSDAVGRRDRVFHFYSCSRMGVTKRENSAGLGCCLGNFHVIGSIVVRSGSGKSAYLTPEDSLSACFGRETVIKMHHLARWMSGRGWFKFEIFNLKSAIK